MSRDENAHSRYEPRDAIMTALTRLPDYVKAGAMPAIADEILFTLYEAGYAIVSSPSVPDFQNTRTR